MSGYWVRFKEIYGFAEDQLSVDLAGSSCYGGCCTEFFLYHLEGNEANAFPLENTILKWQGLDQNKTSQTASSERDSGDRENNCLPWFFLLIDKIDLCWAAESLWRDGKDSQPEG